MFTKYAKPVLILIVVCLLFFYKTILSGSIPFPGDLLLAGYAPWNHQSYEGYVAGAIPTKNQYFDVVRELYPWKTAVISDLKKGMLPLWNPYNFSGAPLLANYQSQVFYPLTFLYFILPQITAWTAMVMIQPILGSIFLYLFAVEIGLTSTAAVLSAILFNFSSFANVWMEFTTVWQTIMWLPLLLYLVERGVKQKGLSRTQQALFIIGLYSAITAGHPQDFINSFLLLIAYTILRVWKAPGWSRAQLLFIFGIPFFIAAPQLLPTVELFRTSARVAHDYQGIITHMLVQWWQLPLLAVSDFFGNPATHSNFTGDFVMKTLSVGVVGLFLATTALWDGLNSWHKKFFAFTGIVVLLITVRTPLSELLYRYPWPVLSTGTPTRVLFVLMLVMSLMAGFGFDSLKKSMKFSARALATIWILFIALWAFTLLQPSFGVIPYSEGARETMKRAMMLSSGILVCLTLVAGIAKYKKLLLIFLVPLVTTELLYSFLKFNPFVPRSFVFPDNKVIHELQTISGIDRFWGYGTAQIEANFATQEHLYSPDGTDPLNLSWYNRFIQSSRDGNIAVTFNRTTRSDALLAPGYGKTDLPENKFRLRLMDLLGVKYVLTRSENPQDELTFPVDRFRLISHVDDWTIYENTKAAPRYFITGDVRPYNDTTDFEKQLFAPDFRPDKTVLLEKSDVAGLPKMPSGGTAKLVSYTPTTVIIQTSAVSPAFLFLSDTFDKGWTATVNGKPTRVYKADFAFRGVLIPKGDATIVFSYMPKSFQTGIFVSILALGLTIIYFSRKRSV